MKTIAFTVLLISLTASFAFAEGVSESESARPTVAEIAAGDERFSTLVTALQAADLVDTLNGSGPFTVFAPTNDAFDALPEGALEGLLANKETLTEVLLYHVAPGRFMASDVVGMSSAETAAGSSLRIMVNDGTVMVNDARVVITDIEGSNGVIHVIDQVVLPPEEMAMADSTGMSSMDIVEIASGDGRFDTLVTAVAAAGLVDTLKSEGPFTVFAPTDDAFAKLPEGTVAALLGDIPALTEILLYHVVPGKVMASDVVALSSASTVAEQDLRIMIRDGRVMINDAEVIITDIQASNGVIHVVDTVILPPA
jgi:uncharacterized surface protein with fasciclin (FAS1) repeats